MVNTGHTHLDIYKMEQMTAFTNQKQCLACWEKWVLFIKNKKPSLILCYPQYSGHSLSFVHSLMFRFFFVPIRICVFMTTITLYTRVTQVNCTNLCKLLKLINEELLKEKKKKDELISFSFMCV